VIIEIQRYRVLIFTSKIKVSDSVVCPNRWWITLSQRVAVKYLSKCDPV
jgi:hypothetical protein